LPEISVDPLSIDFGTVTSGGSGINFFEITSAGGADLVLGEIRQTGSGAFSLQSDPSGDVVAPGSDVPVIVQYMPTVDAGDKGSIFIPSNDPVTPEVEVLLLGNGGGDFEYPVAVIDCPGTSAPPEKINLDGSASYDPNDLTPLTYSWSLTKAPEGSTEELVLIQSDEVRLYTDVAGDYTVQLSVKNLAGLSSAPAKCSIAAIPEDDLHVELSWDTTQADLDLHLIEEGGSFY
jgi:hypothetical protein